MKAVTRERVYTNLKKEQDCSPLFSRNYFNHNIVSSSTGSIRGKTLTVVHAVIPVGMCSELLDGLATQQAGVGGLGPERESCAT